MADFGRLVEAVKREAFSAGKLNVLNEAARVNWFSVDQVKALLRSFSFGADKVTALRQLAPRIIDPQNNFQIYGAFTFSAEKEEAKEILRPYN